MERLWVKRAAREEKTGTRKKYDKKAKPQGHPILRLQRSIGNQAVLRMLRPAKPPAGRLGRKANRVARAQESGKKKKKIARSGRHRKAARPGCPRCRRSKRPDKKNFRKEARSQSPSSASGLIDATLRSPGRPLDQGSREFFEPRLGYDLGHVRVHDDTKAHGSARAVNALAYTLGPDIVFSPGNYSPWTAEGKRLLAHELAHVIQQAGGAGVSAAPEHVQRRVECDDRGNCQSIPDEYDGGYDDGAGGAPYYDGGSGGSEGSGGGTGVWGDYVPWEPQEDYTSPEPTPVEPDTTGPQDGNTPAGAPPAMGGIFGCARTNFEGVEESNYNEIMRCNPDYPYNCRRLAGYRFWEKTSGYDKWINPANCNELWVHVHEQTPPPPPPPPPDPECELIDEITYDPESEEECNRTCDSVYPPFDPETSDCNTYCSIACMDLFNPLPPIDDTDELPETEPPEAGPPDAELPEVESPDAEPQETDELPETEPPEADGSDEWWDWIY